MPALPCKTSFTYPCFVPFQLADPAGVLFFGHAFSLAHQAFEQFIIKRLECSWSEWFENDQWIVPIRHTEGDYFSPIRAGDTCMIELSLKSITQTSFSMVYHFNQSHLCCEVTTVHVFCDRSTKAKIDIPEKILNALRLESTK